MTSANGSRDCGQRRRLVASWRLSAGITMAVLVAGAWLHARQVTTSPEFKAYSRFDFVPGEKIVAVEDFSQDAVGDFPAGWNTNGSGEVVTTAGRPGRWLKLTGGGAFVPDVPVTLPDAFTLEFDLQVPPGFSSGYKFNASLVALSDLSQIQPWQSADNRFTFISQPWETTWQTTVEPRLRGVSSPMAAVTTKQPWRDRGVHVAIARQATRVRVYFNDEKVADVPRALLAGVEYNAILFFVPSVDAGSEYYLGNLRLAVGAADTRNKLLTQGRWTTSGILFEVNSDRISAASYGTLKEVAGVLAENTDVKVLIVGHTDTDGDADANLDLSRRRAAAVKAVMVSEFAIDAARMETDGKGEGEPLDTTTKSAGKARNRRVEFIKR